MAESSFTNFFNNSQTFGLNVSTGYDKTLKQMGKTAGNVAGGVFSPLFEYLEENEEVFNGDLTKELNKLYSSNFNMNLVLQAEDAKVNGTRPSFDTKF
ncbi:MAG: hypothetical protein PHC64_08880 [Candidatus Gastranaerophilales bacterium]|nr:hypothetical protein [Candidatus Gastranaerophilales bacterium]